MKNQMVQVFNQQILGIEPRPVGMMDPAEMAFSVKALRLEIIEMADAYDQGDLVGVVDALIDIDFFRRGILYKHGITPELYDRLFSVVYEKNMQKQLGKSKPDRAELPMDAIKPEGWMGPEEEIRRLLEEHMDAGE